MLKPVIPKFPCGHVVPSGVYSNTNHQKESDDYGKYTDKKLPYLYGIHAL
jgi:hypothetical protein